MKRGCAVPACTNEGAFCIRADDDTFFLCVQHMRRVLNPDTTKDES